MNNYWDDVPIVADFTRGRQTVTEPRRQYDTGQTLALAGLDLPDGSAVVFYQDNAPGVIPVRIEAEEIPIPNTLFASGENIRAYIATGDDGPRREIMIPVKARRKAASRPPDTL